MPSTVAPLSMAPSYQEHHRRPSLGPLYSSPFDFGSLLASRRRSSFTLGLWGSLSSNDNPPIVQTTNSNSTHNSCFYATPNSPPSVSNGHDIFRSFTYRPGKQNSFGSNNNTNNHSSVPCTSSLNIDNTNRPHSCDSQSIKCCNNAFSSVTEYFQHVNLAHLQPQTTHANPLDIDGIDDEDEDSSTTTQNNVDKTWNKLVFNLIGDDEPHMPPPPMNSKDDLHMRRVSAQLDAMQINKSNQDLTSNELKRGDFLTSVFDSDEDIDGDTSIKKEAASPALITTAGATLTSIVKATQGSDRDEDDDYNTSIFMPIIKRAREHSLIAVENKKQRGDEWHISQPGHMGGMVGIPSNNSNNNNNSSNTTNQMSNGNTTMFIPATDTNIFQPNYDTLMQQRQQKLMPATHMMLAPNPQYTSPSNQQLFGISNHTMSPAALHAPHYQPTVMMPASLLSQVPSILSPHYSESVTSSPEEIGDIKNIESNNPLGLYEELDEDWTAHRPSTPTTHALTPGSCDVTESRGRALERIKNQHHLTKSLSSVRSLSPRSRMTPPINDGGGTSPKQRLYRCPKPYCSKVYKNSNGLKYHLERGQCEADNSDAEEGLPEDVRIAVRPYYCKAESCGKRYKNLNGLKYHAKVAHPSLDFRTKVKGHLPPCQ